MAARTGWWNDIVNSRLEAQYNGTTFMRGTASAVTWPVGFTVTDDLALGLGTGNPSLLEWVTDDANSNHLVLQLPAGGSVDVPVVAIGQGAGILGDMGLWNGTVDPLVSVLAAGAVTTGPVLEFRKARGTLAAPTVVTTGDDVGQIRTYAAVAAGEYVQTASIEFDCAGTIATTRGPGTITFFTATDAAPSVLTQAMQISAAQLVTVAAGLTVSAGTVTVSGVTDTTGANTGIVQVGGGLSAVKSLATGKAATGTGKVLFSGTTSGIVTLSVADAAGTWTMKLPTAVGTSGFQLTDAAGDGVCTWAAAGSHREYKNVLGERTDADAALETLVNTPVYDFRYKEGVPSTGDLETRYTGIMAEEAPWAMHFKGGIVNPINALGYTLLGFKSLVKRIEQLEAQLA